MKTLVNIFDPQEPLAAYLFVKQYYSAGDNLLFISTREDRDAVSQYASSLHIDAACISVIAFKRSEDSYIYERICRRLRSRLSPEGDYWVNLAGAPVTRPWPCSASLRASIPDSSMCRRVRTSSSVRSSTTVSTITTISSSLSATA